MTNPPAAIVQPATVIDFERLADAIRREENSKSHPYGVMVDGLTEAQARSWCIRICKQEFARFQRRKRANTWPSDYFDFLSFRYCWLNRESWSANVRSIYNQHKTPPVNRPK